MIELICFAGGVLAGAGGLWLHISPRLTKLANLTDRDERGRFVKRGD